MEGSEAFPRIGDVWDRMVANGLVSRSDLGKSGVDRQLEGEEGAWDLVSRSGSRRAVGVGVVREIRVCRFHTLLPEPDKTETVKLWDGPASVKISECEDLQWGAASERASTRSDCTSEHISRGA